MPAYSPARAIVSEYATFKPAGGFLNAPESWVGEIRPFAGLAEEQVFSLIDDLDADAQVLVSAGSLRHDPGCSRAHAWTKRRELLRDLQRDAFFVRVIVWPPPVHPKVIALHPDISSSAFKAHPHLFCGGIFGFFQAMPDALCTYRPGDGDWSWQSHDLVDFIDYAAIYLAKHSVWVRTGGDDGGIWIGKGASHAAKDLIQQLDPNGECRCGSGRPYRYCHLESDRREASWRRSMPDSFSVLGRRT